MESHGAALRNFGDDVLNLQLGTKWQLRRLVLSLIAEAADAVVVFHASDADVAAIEDLLDGAAGDPQEARRVALAQKVEAQIHQGGQLQLIAPFEERVPLRGRRRRCLSG